MTVGPAVGVAVIRRIVRQKRAAFRLCYQGGLQRARKLRGRISVEFSVDPSGAVTRATETSSTTMPDAAVVQCVVRSFDALVFPRLSAAALRVDYPLEFVP
ncbi:MAG TPA: AgmX/PglI C-terminal domain-containing protein [Polyangiaceae bacterium]|nr:AgmX/PglI C-terminal domain-containing protein [Polyangiaceae bacterium]